MTDRVASLRWVDEPGTVTAEGARVSLCGGGLTRACYGKSLARPPPWPAVTALTENGGEGMIRVSLIEIERKVIR